MKKTIHIEGMSCMHCVGRVDKALSEISGVEKVEVNLEEKNAVVALDTNVTNEALTEAVKKAGYEVKNIEG